MNYKILLVLIIGFVFSKCTTDSLSPYDLVVWVDDEQNNLIKKQVVANLEYKLQYRPVDYIIAREIKKNNINSLEYKERVKELEGMEYFKFTLTSLDSKKNVFEINNSEINKTEYVSFEMAKDFKMIMNNKEIPCELYHFEQQNGIYQSINILLGFVKPKTQTNEFTLSFENNLNNEGKINFYFSKDDIQEIPTMITTK